MILESGTLLVGVEYEGKTHTAFTLRPAIVRDSIDAEKEAGGKGNVFLMACTIARQIQSLGEIPKEKITGEMIAGLYDADLEILQKAREAAEKKIRAPKGA